MKIKVKIVLLLANMMVLGTVLTGCGQISVSAKQVQIELGGEVPSDLSDYVYIEQEMAKQVKNNAKLDVSEVDAMTVGKYKVRIYYGGNEIVSEVSVVDTTPPEILLKDTEFSAGSVVSANDLAEVKDFSNVTFKILYRYPNGEELLVDDVHLVLGMMVELKAVDEYGNEVIIETLPNIVYEQPHEEEDYEDRSYESFFDFPYGMEYVDEEAYRYIQKAYADFNWYSEFETGDLTQYDFYKEKYRELVNNTAPFFNPETGMEIYLNDFEPLNNYESASIYYFFDIDKDNAPELCIRSERQISVFKYDINRQQFSMWKYIEQGHYSLSGSLAMRWDNGSGAVFYKLDENGEEVCSISFMIRNAYNAIIGPRYLVSLPVYAEAESNEIDENIVKQGYYDRSAAIYYFRVTESQYDELTNDYYQARVAAEHELADVTYYSYEKLFGEE